MGQRSSCLQVPLQTSKYLLAHTRSVSFRRRTCSLFLPIGVLDEPKYPAYFKNQDSQAQPRDHTRTSGKGVSRNCRNELNRNQGARQWKEELEIPRKDEAGLQIVNKSQGKDTLAAVWRSCWFSCAEGSKKKAVSFIWAAGEFDKVLSVDSSDGIHFRTDLHSCTDAARDRRLFGG